MAEDEKPGKATEESRTESGAGIGPGMGMGMMKKMMAQMGQGGGPMAMMQKMMAQMKPGEGGLPPMEQMMGMCGEMLATMQHTAAMATFATPELRDLFSHWLESLEAQALAALKDKGELDPAQLAQALKISPDGALYLLIQMARQNKVSLRVQASQTQ